MIRVEFRLVARSRPEQQQESRNRHDRCRECRREGVPDGELAPLDLIEAGIRDGGQPEQEQPRRECQQDRCEDGVGMKAAHGAATGAA